MVRIVSSQKLLLLAFFATTILIGAALLYFPFSWSGAHRLRYIDALFTATSAVCVTGLTSVDTSSFSLIGQIIILLLIQIGGLGIITFTTVYLTAPRRKISFRSVNVIREYYLDTVEYNATNIVRNIVVFTLSIELAGAFLLYWAFRPTVPRGLVFAALFHAVSAFCNAGFSTFSANLGGFATRPFVLLTIAALVFFGGIGFVVMQDVSKRIFVRRHRLSLHSRLALVGSGVLIAVGAVIFYLFERGNTFAGLAPVDRVVNALFQSVTPRTAGFNAIDESQMRLSSQIVTIVLMFIGGSAGSTAGGIKVTTMAIIFIAMLRGVGFEGELRVGKRVLGSQTIANAHIFAVKALVLLFSSILLLTITELRPGASGPSFLEIAFEACSAFGTVGLSLGLTPHLSDLGKLIIVLTMYAGRVGLITLVLPGAARRPQLVDYPRGEVLIG